MSIAEQETVLEQNGESEATGSMQLVSFRLAEEEYGIEITKIREIILMGEITRVPQTPHYVKGLINLRSTVIPVIDLRTRFALPEEELTDESRIMVLHVGTKTIGIIVDAVRDQQTIQAATDRDGERSIPLRCVRRRSGRRACFRGSPSSPRAGN